MPSFPCHFDRVDGFRAVWEESLHRGELFVLSEASPDIGAPVTVELTTATQTLSLEGEVIGLESDASGAPGIRVAFTQRQLPGLRAFADRVLHPGGGEVGSVDTAIPEDAATIERADFKDTHVRGRDAETWAPTGVPPPRRDATGVVPPPARPAPDGTGVLPARPPPLGATGVLPTPTGRAPALGPPGGLPRPATPPLPLVSRPPLEPTVAGPRVTAAALADAGDTARLAPGTVVDGRFQVDAHIGEGGMGEVYRASHVYLKRTVALKVLHRRLVSNPDAWARFQREAELVSQLEGPNIVRVFDFGRFSDGQPFLAMEFVEGEGLDRRLERGPLEVKEAVTLLQQVCEGLAEAHALGIVHRDLKPPNIMLGRRRDGKVVAKILDFGIARLAAAGQEKLTATGAVVGTPSYLAPEQAQGGDIDARTDLYALGCVAYEVLTGRVPFQAESLARLILMHLQEQPRPLEAFRPSLGEWPALSAVVLKALEKDPKARFESVAAFAEALERAVTPEAPLAAPEPEREAAWAVEKMPVITAPTARTVEARPPPPPQPPPGIGAKSGLSGLTAAFVPSSAPATPAPPSRGTPQPPARTLARPTSLTASDYARAATDGTDGRLGRLGEVLAQFNFPLSPDRVARCEQARAAMPSTLPAAWVLALEPLGAADAAAFGTLLTRCTDVALSWGGALDDVSANAFVYVFFGLGAQARALLAAVEVLERLEATVGPTVRMGLAAGRLVADPDGPLSGDAVGGARALMQAAGKGDCLVPRGFVNAVSDLVEVQPLDDVAAKVLGRRPVSARASATVGFEAALTALEARLSALARGEVVPLVVTGPRRSGRTHLAQEFGLKAQQTAALVTYTSGVRAGAGPYGGFVELVCHLTNVPFPARQTALPAALDALRLPAPHREAVLLLAQQRPAPGPMTPRQAAHALRVVLQAAAAGRPVVCLVDGLDQGDEAGAEAFAELCATRAPNELLVGFGGVELAAQVPRAHHQPLPVLGPAEADRLLTGFLGNPPSAELREALLQRSGGLPGLLVDYALLTAERGALRPRGDALVLEGVVPQVAPADLPAARLDALGTRAARLAWAVSVLGDGADGATSAKVLPGLAQAVWPRVVASRALRSAGHGKVSVAPAFEGALQALDAPWKASMAPRLALVLQELARATPSLRASVAEHLGRAGDAAKAGPLWRTVAEQALAERDVATLARAQEGMAEVLAHHAHATSRQAVTARLELSSRAAGCALLAREVPRAQAVLARALELADQAQLAPPELLLARARVLRATNQRDEAALALEEALTAGQGAPCAAAVFAEVGEAREAADDGAGAVEAWQQALSLADGWMPVAPWYGELDFRARAESRLGSLLMTQQQFPRARPFLQQAVERWKAVNAPLYAARVMANLGTLCVQTSAFREATQWFHSAATTAEAGGDLLFQARQLVSLCRVLSKLVDARLPAVMAATLEVCTALKFEDGLKALKALSAKR
ncbi:MAG: protein kinase [Myxococcaceae bacterium]|nr:protein kinase [Myxococcaceae bacterium]